MSGQREDVPPIVVVMGVSGSGKSTIGEALAEALGVPFIDGDALHPAANVAKMAAGIPLVDADRWPWLDAVGRALREAEDSGEGLVVACSALKRGYRDRIAAAAPASVFVHLAGSRDVLSRRLGHRRGHFMPATLLDSQLATLQPLQPGERGLTVDIDAPVGTVVHRALEDVRALEAGT